MNSSKTVKVGLYQHFKGNHYYVYGTAKHSENEELLVVYAPDKKRDDLWVRPVKMFLERVSTESGDVERFKFIR